MSDATWRQTTLGSVITLQRGFDITKKEQHDGPYPVISSSGTGSTHDEYKVEGPGVVIGRKGSLGGVYYSPGAFWPHDTTLWVKDFKGSEPRFVYYWLQTLGLEHFDVGASNPTLNRNHVHMLPALVPDIATQQIIASVLTAYDELIENTTRRIAILEEMAQAIYREWFVEFRYPGHADVPQVDSDLGPIPEGWEVCTIADLASAERFAVTSGPFGSKLGRKDYRESGVPVIRGANLAVGGGFRDSDFVFVSAAKADELRSCTAGPGDIVVTQRGTLGQVGLIPASARHARYVLSQSQMKITVNDKRSSHHYVYAVLRSPEATEHIQNMAMSAGVPHINLTMLRDLAVVLPPRLLQLQFELAVSPMLELAEALRSSNANLSEARDLLLPGLISGEVDVSGLDIDAGDAAA